MAVHIMVMMKNVYIYMCPETRHCLKESIQETSSEEVLMDIAESR